MQTVTLDFFGCKYIYDIYMVIQNAFEFPDYFGKNLDALWDFLDCYTDEDLCIQLKGISSLSSELQEAMIEILAIFERVHKYNPNMTFNSIH